jgi:hypothetical protein
VCHSWFLNLLTWRYTEPPAWNYNHCSFAKTWYLFIKKCISFAIRCVHSGAIEDPNPLGLDVSSGVYLPTFRWILCVHLHVQTGLCITLLAVCAMCLANFIIFDSITQTIFEPSVELLHKQQINTVNKIRFFTLPFTLRA